MTGFALMASVFESSWHVVTADACGGAPIALCGHRIFGPVRRRFDLSLLDGVPLGDGRGACSACRATLDEATGRAL